MKQGTSTISSCGILFRMILNALLEQPPGVLMLNSLRLFNRESMTASSSMKEWTPRKINCSRSLLPIRQRNTCCECIWQSTIVRLWSDFIEESRDSTIGHSPEGQFDKQMEERVLEMKAARTGVFERWRTEGVYYIQEERLILGLRWNNWI